MNESKVCKDCGRELPLDHFRVYQNGTIASICKSCHAKRINASTKANRAAKIQTGRGTRYSDPEFDGMTPREVQDVLARAARWLNNYGGFTCEVSLRYEKSIALPIR